MTHKTKKCSEKRSWSRQYISPITFQIRWLWIIAASNNCENFINAILYTSEQAVFRLSHYFLLTMNLSTDIHISRSTPRGYTEQSSRNCVIAYFQTRHSVLLVTRAQRITIKLETVGPKTSRIHFICKLLNCTCQDIPSTC